MSMEWPHLPVGVDKTSLTIGDGLCCALARIGGIAHEVFPAERVALGVIAASRASDFAAGRHCARAALGGLGVAPVVILIGPGGAPIWPSGSSAALPIARGLQARSWRVRTVMYQSASISSAAVVSRPNFTASVH